MILLKARAMPNGAVRHYANGETFRKVGGTKGWEYVGKMGSAKAKAAEEEARKNGLPIIHAEPKGGSQKGPDEPKPPTSRASTNIAVDPAKVKAHPIPPDLLKKWKANGGVNNPEYRKWVEEHWAQGAPEHKPEENRRSAGGEPEKKTPPPPTDDGLETDACADFYNDMPPEQFKAHALEYFNVKISDRVTAGNKKLWVPIMVNMAQLNGLGFKTRIPVRVTFAKRSAGKHIGIAEEREEGGKLFTAAAFYQPHSKTIFMGREYDDTFAHEYFHHLDYTMLGYKGSERKLHWDEEQKKYLPIPGEMVPKTGTKERRAFLDALKGEKAQKPTFLERCKAKDLAKGYKENPYYANETEIIARTGEAMFNEMAFDKDWLPVRRQLYRPAMPGYKDTNTYMSPEELKEFRAAFVKMFNAKDYYKKQGILIKSVIGVAAQVVDPTKVAVYYSQGEEDLSKGKLLKIEDMPGAKSGKTKKLFLLSPSGHMVEAAWKGKQERDVRKGNIPVGTSWQRERLAYLVSEILGLGNVPPVVVRRVDGKLGSAMGMVYADTWKASGLEYKDVHVREWQKLAVLDWLICMTDRHRRNWLVDDSGKFWAIDNDLSFPEKVQYGMFQGYRSRPHWYLNENKTLALMDDIVRLFSQEKKREILVQMVKYGIAPMGRVIFASRWEQLVAEKALPPYVEDDKGFMAKPKEE